ncbi:zinc finger protein OZF-like isoform X1 [Varroa jacobsoni]|uniref:zinc finger protein OZF-like isoform X1 n=1 Tax=Varroa jacobsoni TaxID=62625 RepID=UPI000BF7543F|nr:zinc finger protein OZF-like isoform X1 [Varroa jacobsoni]
MLLNTLSCKWLPRRVLDNLLCELRIDSFHGNYAEVEITGLKVERAMNLDGLNQELLLKFDELKKQWDSKDIVDSVIVALTATEKADIKKEIDNDIRDLETRYGLSEGAAEEVLAFSGWDLSSAETTIERAIQVIVLAHRIQIKEGTITDPDFAPLQLARATPDRKRRFQCEHCQKTFPYRSRLVAHVVTHTGEKSFECSHCSSRFGREDLLIIHERFHLNDKPYRCKIRGCNARFTASKYLTMHSRTHDDNRLYKCKVCSSTFRTSAHLRCHMQYHGGDEGRTRCKVCDQQMFISSLRRHMFLHGKDGLTRDRPLECEICGAKMRDTFQLQVHSRIHTGVRPFACEHCDRFFGSTNTLQKHRRTHTLEKPFTCATCGSAFARKDTLSVHERSHRGERPFSCKECPRKFTQRAHLFRHVKSLHSDKVVKVQASARRRDENIAAKPISTC